MALEENREGGGTRLLNGWKQIAAYFGKDESTAKRWAAGRGLPVHRVPGQKRATVYAYAAELELWLRHQGGLGAVEPAPSPPKPLAAVAAASARWSLPALAATALGVVALLGLIGFALVAWRPDTLARLAAHQPPAAAESLYLDGVYHLEKRTGEGIQRAIGLFTSAVAADPDYAKAYVGIADAYNLISQYTDASPDEAYPKARAAAERALLLDPTEAGAYAALGFNSFYGRHDLGDALTLLGKAVALDPTNAKAHHWYALTAMHDRRFDVALREISEAQRLAPSTPAILANKGLILFHAGRPDDALSILRPLADTEPTLMSPHAYLATIYLSTGRLQDFLRESRLVAEMSKSEPDRAIVAAAERGFAEGGRPAMLAAMLAEQQRLYALGEQPAFKLALTEAMLGETRQALDYLNASESRHEQDILGIRLEPALQGLRDLPGYRSLVAEVGFDLD